MGKLTALEWKPVKQVNLNDYHGSKPFIVEYRSKIDPSYKLIKHWQTGGTWSAKRNNHPVATCTSLDKARDSAERDYANRAALTKGSENSHE